MDPGGARPEPPSASIGEKRPTEVRDGDSDDQLRKKKKGALDGDMKRVAEIVLVLSALGKTRGGRSPTAVEKGLMVEAREKLVEMCEVLAPRDLLSSSAVRAVIEDLGLNRSRDQKLGFRPPKMSISEKLLLTKRKMRESKEFTAQPATYSLPLLQVGFGATTESRGSLLQAGHRFPPEKPIHTPVTAGAFQSVSSTIHVSNPSSTSSSNQLSVCEKGSSSLALPRVGAAHFQLDERSNGSGYESQANPPVDHSLDKPQTFSLQPQPVAVAKLGQTKVPNHSPIRTEETSHVGNTSSAFQAVKDQIRKPYVIQAASGNLPSVFQPSVGMNFMQTSSLHSNHSDIARNVQKFLQPRAPEHPNWIPPSIDYMNKTLTCQVCKVTISDLENLLVCDACEKGIHLKCLQSYSLKGIPKGEWHCPRCLMSNNGKPLPPKYGRVIRSINAAKVSSTTTGAQFSLEKVESSDQKINHQKVTNGNLSLLNPAHVGDTENDHIESAFDLKTIIEREAQGANITVNRTKHDSCQTMSSETTGAIHVLCSNIPNQSSIQPTQHSGSPQCDTQKLSGADIDSSHGLQALCNSKDASKTGPLNYAEVCENQCHVNNHFLKENEISGLRETSECKASCNIRGDAQDVAETRIGTLTVGGGARDCTRSSLNGLHSVDWIGNILQVVDDKAFYQSCCINGIVYKLQDHALFLSSNDSLRPSKLQSLWEDTRTRSKWAAVNLCYLPSDLPEVVGQPCTPEVNEVYESNHDSTVMAGLIQGPCDVLPSNKFKEEVERRKHLENGAHDGLQRVFLCKWFYDEPKGLFRAVTDQSQ
ncbi:PREDICTED: uncharacterized protein LOC104606535 [Nelumbo nucifera]|uniref:Uncharacterized protein LOC104606535 n=2 Tax=Nelumbo nucifera TaxID=4432 RepID=A0A1U8AQH8_NELNU|nr:PREDICTED: uncharacterized protein LOC104606535 [Nelumbo nucifera]DAD20342.1 TPA_asm: hypothetical protein HUJ06_021805 [Nelumbo nucifera]